MKVGLKFDLSVEKGCAYIPFNKSEEAQILE